VLFIRFGKLARSFPGLNARDKMRMLADLYKAPMTRNRLLTKSF